MTGDRYTSVNEWIFQYLFSLDQKIAFRDCANDKSITFADFVKDVDLLRSFFIERGLKDEKIALASENSYRWIVTALGIICSGNCFVPIDVELAEEHICVRLTMCNARWLYFLRLFRMCL